MKKGILIVLGMLMITSNIEAKKDKLTAKNIEGSYSYDNAITFVERGVKFHLFLNGEFNFDARYNDRYFNSNGRRIKRTRVRIKRNFNGQIKQVGNVSISYDFKGNVRRIGNVFMQYRHGNLTKAGNLKINYTPWGTPRFFGQVKNNGFYYNNVGSNYDNHFGDIFNYNDAYFYRKDFRDNYIKVREDNTYYYYKAKPNAKIGKRSTILKRRKQDTKKVSPKKNTRRGDTSYKKQDKAKEADDKKKSKRTISYRNRIR
jgi:hypothetical protein